MSKYVFVLVQLQPQCVLPWTADPRNRLTLAREKLIRSFLLFSLHLPSTLACFDLRNLSFLRTHPPPSLVLDIRVKTPNEKPIVFVFLLFGFLTQVTNVVYVLSVPPPSSISYSSSLCCYPTLGRGELTLGVLLYDTYSTHETRLDQGTG